MECVFFDAGDTLVYPGPPVGEVFEELGEHFALPGVWRVYADVFPALGALRGKELRLGLVSNWDSRLAPETAHSRVIASLGELPDLLDGHSEA